MILHVDRKWMAAFFNKFYGKMWLGFCLNTRKHFFVEVFFKKKPAERSYVALKSGTRDFEIALRLRDRQAFKWQLPEIVNVFTTFALKQVFWKSKRGHSKSTFVEEQRGEGGLEKRTDTNRGRRDLSMCVHSLF